LVKYSKFEEIPNQPYSFEIAKFAFFFGKVKRLLLLFSCLPGVVGAQYSFDFEDGALNSWVQLPSNRWEISSEAALSGSYSLHHAYDNSSSGIDGIAVFTEHVDPEDTLSIRFRYRHGYAPSSTNNWQFAIMAASSGLTAVPPPDGLYLGVNFSGSDDLLRLWKVNGGVKSVLAESELNLQQEGCEDDEPWILAKRNPGGSWEILFSRSGVPAEAVIIARAVDSTDYDGQFFGLRYSYSSAQDRKFWLDDLRIEGTFYTDTRPPVLEEVQFAGLQSVSLLFDEAVSLGASSFVSVEGFYADSLLTDGKKILAFFSKTFPNRINLHLRAGNISDSDGNILQTCEADIFQNLPVFGDILIYEVMADPSPPVYLPECEYIELLNRSAYPLNTDGWLMAINERQVTLPSCEILPGEMVCIVPEACQALEGKGFLHILSSSALSNSGGLISLEDQYGRALASVVYPDAGTRGSWKGEGGWSLEWPDPDRICAGPDFWEFSLSDAGGTPGKKNSVHRDIPDQMAPGFEYAGVTDSSIQLNYNEPLALDLPQREDFRLLPWDLVPAGLSFTGPERTALNVRFTEPVELFRSGRLILPAFGDCAGNISAEDTLLFGYPGNPEQGSLLLSEVMYDPVDGFPEFIELYNGSERFADLSLYSISVSASGEDGSNPHILADDSHLAAPGAYLVLTPDRNNLAIQYDRLLTGNWLVPGQFTQLSNSGGHISLLNRSGQQVDEMYYEDGMHNLFLGDAQGVSLERLSFERSGSEKSNWHSASAAAGYASPGRANSQAVVQQAADSLVTLSTSLLTPDNDGADDVLGILLTPGETGVVIDIEITDLYGYLVRKLATAALAGFKESWFWDGMDDLAMPVPAGIYVVQVTFLYPGGQRGVVRKALAVSYR